MGKAMGRYHHRMEGLGGRLGGLELVPGSVARPISVSSAGRILSLNAADSMPIY